MPQQPSNQPQQAQHPQQTSSQVQNSQQPAPHKKEIIVRIIVALIGAAAIVLAAILGGPFLLASKPIPTPIPISTTVSDPTPTQRPVLEQQNISLPGSKTPNEVHFKSLVKAGDLIVVAITQDVTTITSIKDNHRNDDYTPVLTEPMFANRTEMKDYVELYYAKNVTGGDTKVTVTFTSPPKSEPNSGDSNVGIYEFSGLDKTSPLGPVVSQYGTGQIPDGGMLSTSQDNDVIFVVGIDSGLDNPNDPNINTPANHGKDYQMLSLDQPHWDSQNYERFYAECQIAKLGPHNTDFTLKYSSNWAVIGAIFKV